MAKNKKTDITAQDAMELSEEQMVTARKQLRETMREKFDKWMTIYDEDATTEDINKAKEEFDAEVKLNQEKTFVISKDHALEYAKLTKDWNAKYNHWEKGAWKGVIMYDKVVSEYIAKYEADPTLPFEVDYATFMYLYQSMSNPSGNGLEAAQAMADFENYDPTIGEQKVAENYVTYSHLLQNILELIRELTAVDKKLKLMRERINIETAGIKFDWKISELEEFIELHDAWIGTAVPEGEELAKM